MKTHILEFLKKPRFIDHESFSIIESILLMILMIKTTLSFVVNLSDTTILHAETIQTKIVLNNTQGL